MFYSECNHFCNKCWFCSNIAYPVAGGFFLWKNIFILFYNAQNGITILSFLVLFFSQKQNKQNQRWCDMPIDHEQPQYKVLEVL